VAWLRLTFVVPDWTKIETLVVPRQHGKLSPKYDTPPLVCAAVSMAPSKAVAWPDEIYDDQDIMSLDAQGKFIMCRVCAESFLVYGGKTPKPVNMNACYRTRAWETHKRRTRAHRKNEHPGTGTGSPRRAPGMDLIQSVRSNVSEYEQRSETLARQQDATAPSGGSHRLNLQYPSFKGIVRFGQ
jgi:hypothetical protein